MTPLIINTCGWNPLCGGVRVMNYLAALLHGAGVPVFVDEECHYNPLIPIRRDPADDCIVIYPDGTRGNPYGAKRFCRYMLYYASGYFKGDRITKDECCIVFHRAFFKDVQAHCDHALTDDDIITIPYLDSMWCFPELKRGKACMYQGKGKPIVGIDAMPIPGGRGCLFTSRQRTLAILRAAENFYTSDKNTIMSLEARLCGCKVWIVDGDKIEEQTGTEDGDYVLRACDFIMNPMLDMALARQFADRVYKFFGL